MFNCFSLRVEPSSQNDNHHHRHHNRSTALFLGAGARTEFLNFMVQGKINRRRHTDHPMDATPSGLSSAHLHHHPSKITVSNNWSAVSGWISLSSGRQRQSTEVINGDCCGSEQLLHPLTHWYVVCDSNSNTDIAVRWPRRDARLSWLRDVHKSTFTSMTLKHRVLRDAVSIAFSALTLLVGCHEEHPACKIEWWGAGVVICLQRRTNDLHMVYCHSIISCFIKIQNGLTFLVPAYPVAAKWQSVSRICL